MQFTHVIKLSSVLTVFFFYFKTSMTINKRLGYIHVKFISIITQLSCLLLISYSCMWCATLSGNFNLHLELLLSCLLSLVFQCVESPSLITQVYGLSYC